MRASQAKPIHMHCVYGARQPSRATTSRMLCILKEVALSILSYSYLAVISLLLYLIPSVVIHMMLPLSFNVDDVLMLADMFAAFLNVSLTIRSGPSALLIGTAAELGRDVLCDKLHAHTYQRQGGFKCSMLACAVVCRLSAGVTRRGKTGTWGHYSIQAS